VDGFNSGVKGLINMEVVEVMMIIITKEDE
jgi:hypothetical protein